MSIKFIFLTDSHHYPDAPKDFGPPKMLTASSQVLHTAIPAVNVLEPQFIVHGGDLICGGGSFNMPRQTYLRALTETHGICQGFKAPTYYIPGNHDCDSQEYSFDLFLDRFAAPAVLSIIEAAPRLRLALANVYQAGWRESGGNGIWNEQLDSQLQEAAQKATYDNVALFLIIHPWVLPAHTANDGMLTNATKLLSTITAHPSIAAVFTGHRHTNRIRLYRDVLFIDTACLIGFPMGFRHINLHDDGYLTTVFHTLDLPDLLKRSEARSEPLQNQLWQGEIHDRETTIFVPRLHQLWR